MENLTKKVQEAMLSAEQEAVKRSNQYVTLFHLIYAFQNQNDGLFSTIFKKTGEKGEQKYDPPTLLPRPPPPHSGNNVWYPCTDQHGYLKQNRNRKCKKTGEKS